MTRQLSSYYVHEAGKVRPSKRIRAKIRHAALTILPMRLSGGRLARAPGLRRFQRVERSVNLPNLPTYLDGLRVTHLSDLHVGSLLQPADLPRIIRATNAMGGHIIAVTGDFIDLSVSVLDDVVEAFLGLSAPLGVYLVPGNHDYLDDGPQLIRRMRDRGLRLMINEHHEVAFRDCRIGIVGLDYTSKRKVVGHMLNHATRDVPHRDSQDLRLLLAHHPHAFDVAQDFNVDLTLSGHTHGGQLALRRRFGPNATRVSVGGLACRYDHGLYQRGHRYLHVTAGVGSWLPWRVNCPADITCLTLRSQADTESMSHPM